MSPERIAEEGWGCNHGHVERYQWASKLINETDTVLDIACGVGYGAGILSNTDCIYVGVDKPGVPSPTFAAHGTFIETDIDHWQPDFEFDVAVCFETLEHVEDLEHLLGIVKKARRMVLVSVPTVPTVGINEWHVRDFTEDDIPPLFEGWNTYHVFYQGVERSHVWAFTRP